MQQFATEYKSKAEQKKAREERRKNRDEERRRLKTKIVKLLKEKAIKMPASDIDAFLKHQNVDEIKELCEEMYHNGEISRTANYRYFIQSQKKKELKKPSTSKPESIDPTEEIMKYATLRDDGIISEEDFQKKKKKLLDL